MHFLPLGNYFLSTQNLNVMKKISSVVIATHFFSYGPGQALRDYFKKNTSVQLIYLEHNLFGNVLTWAYHILKNIYITLTSLKKHDLYVGCNNLNALSGIILKKIGVVKYTIYYCIDFSPNRFSNYFLNKIYLLLDQYCVKNSDSVWNCCAPTMGLDPMILMRESIGLPRQYRKKQIAVQDGTEIIRLPDEGQITENKIGFVGHLKVENGLFTLIEAYKIVRSQVPGVSLMIIGSGPIEEQIHAALNGDENVEMTGYMGDIKQVLNKLSHCSIGVAPYEVNNLTPYSDPGKVKAYMSAGLAIVMSSVPDIAKFVDENGCGIVCEPGDPNKLATALLEVIKNKDLQFKFRASSKSIRENLTWDSTYNKVFDGLSMRFK